MSDTGPITPLSAEVIAATHARALHEGILRRTIVAVDELLSVATGGQPHMTISARAAIAAEHGSEVGKAITSFLNLFQPDHGLLAEVGDEARNEASQQSLQPEIAAETVPAPEGAPVPPATPAEDLPHLHDMADAVEGSTETPADSNEH